MRAVRLAERSCTAWPSQRTGLWSRPTRMWAAPNAGERRALPRRARRQTAAPHARAVPRAGRAQGQARTSSVANWSPTHLRSPPPKGMKAKSEAASLG